MVSPPTVAVIGCGPGGMSFLHAIALHRQKFEKDGGDQEALSAMLPLVTVFERSSEPGGVWRAQKNNSSSSPSSTSTSSTTLQVPPAKKDDIDVDDKTYTRNDSECEEDEDEDDLVDDNEQQDKYNDSDNDNEDEDEDWDYIVEHKVDSTTSMYEALWTNGPNQTLEYFDYTFDEHFKQQPLPIFLPRGPILEYMLKRVTRHNPNFFDPVRFNTTVKSVTYNPIMGKFEIYSMDNITNQIQIELFDKCIWAAGDNGCKKIPRSVHTILRKGNFEGIDIHSSEAGGVLGDFKGKRIVMVGDGLSAEDLALQALKLGIEKIFVIARSGSGVCSDTKTWPGGKVEVIWEMVISKVIQDGKGLQLAEMEFDVEKDQSIKVDDGDIRDLTDISAVIYCTGYEENNAMLDPAIIKSIGREGFKKKRIVTSDWKMEPNLFTKELGNVKPSKVLGDSCRNYLYVSPSLHHGVSIDNTNLFILSVFSDYPLLEIDVKAWFFLGVIIGNVTLPSKKEMKDEMYSLLREGMQIPYVRMEIDPMYREAVTDLQYENEDYWSCNIPDPIQYDLEMEAERFSLKQLGREMKDGAYPSQLFSSIDDDDNDDELNGKGELVCQMNMKLSLERSRPEKTSWRTFRDVDPSGFVSLHTGTASVPFKNRWIDLDDNDPHPHLSSLPTSA